MIQVKNLSKKYGSFLALNNVSFDVKKGDIAAFLGPNGAGKTTTMRIITGFLSPTSGEVHIDGLDVFEESKKVKTMTGYLPENPPLYPELTVKEYLSFVAELKGVNKTDIMKSVEKVIIQTDLTDRKNTMISLLSKGLKQRVGIAQSIVNSPKVIILDEPTVGLDPIQVVEIRNLIKRLAKEEDRTVILSTHLLAEAQEICEKAIIIHNGSIMAVDTIEHLKQKEKMGMMLSVKVRKNQAGLIPLLKKEKGVISVTAVGEEVLINTGQDMREKIAKMIVENNCGLLELIQKDSSLEDIFIKLVK